MPAFCSSGYGARNGWDGERGLDWYKRPRGEYANCVDRKRIRYAIVLRHGFRTDVSVCG